MMFDYKFCVVKNDDILGALTEKEIEMFDDFLVKIRKYRKDNDKTDNNYFVINMDEPYAQQIAQIMKDNGHYCENPIKGNRYIAFDEEFDERIAEALAGNENEQGD